MISEIKSTLIVIFDLIILSQMSLSCNPIVMTCLFHYRVVANLLGLS